MSTVTTGAVARRPARWGSPFLLAAVLGGLLAMHGLQPSPGPVPTPSVLALHSGHANGFGMPMPADTRHGDGKRSPHDGHGGGQVCLAFLLAGLLLLLLLLVMAAVSRFIALPIRPFLRPFLPRGPTARPRGPTLTQLCVIRV
ncbi:hypothetical protein GCM10009530_62130 [Microbispora corallina]|uniref:DUF2946 domain-containing protein n=1 Tax=Microbispora corallina TaxID=83302 RepID=A0ABQ4G7X4_9ACTN|nr:hypothetical protein Mco01_61460 [Microbispora corallina]